MLGFIIERAEGAARCRERSGRCGWVGRPL